MPWNSNLKIQNRDLVHYLEDAKRNLEQKMMERTREIERQKMNITDSLHYATRIQNALMLPAEELDRIMPSYFVLNKPKDIVSGDFYWVSRQEDRLILAVADCTGHGVPGAFMSILGITFLNEIVSKMEPPRPGSILNELRSWSSERSVRPGKGTKPGRVWNWPFVWLISSAANCSSRVHSGRCT